MIVAMLVFVGVTALGGGAALIAGGDLAPPVGWLDGLPLIHSWTVPGIVLATVFGAGSLAAAYGEWRRRDWARAATIGVGAALVGWIVVQLVVLPRASYLQALYGIIGLALSCTPRTRRSAPRRRSPTAPRR